MSSSSRPTASWADMAGIELRSPSFGDHQPIPARHAKDHDNLSPALEWSGVPEEAVELAVLCEDPDAPRGTFIHWVLAGLQPTAAGLAEGEHPAATVEGRNDVGEERLQRPYASGRGRSAPVLLPGLRRVGAAGAGGRGASRRPAPCPGGQGAGQRHPCRHLPALTAAQIDSWRLNSWNLNDRGGRLGSLHWRKES